MSVLLAALLLPLAAQPAPMPPAVRERVAQTATAHARKVAVVRHIVVSDRAQAERLLAALRALPAAERLHEFARLAQAHSLDAASASHGGQLGWIRGGETEAAFDDAVFGGPLRELHGPIETAFGWHILYVEERFDFGASSPLR